MGWLTAKAYDRVMRGAEYKHFSDWRKQALAPVAGTVLEIGSGTGANLSYYGELDRLVLLEPDKHMRRQLLAKIDKDFIEVGKSKAEDLPYDDNTFDWVVSTLVLCSVAKPKAALSEIRRVLKPKGKLAFVEHVLDYEDASNRKRQKRWQPLWGLVAASCQVTRDTEATMKECGFDMRSIEYKRLGLGPQIVRPVILGHAKVCS